MTRVYIIVILILLLLGGAGTIAWLYKKWRSAEQESKSLTKLNGSNSKIVHYYKNKYGNQVAVNDALQLENKTIRGLIKEGGVNELKQFNKIPAKKISGFAGMTVQLRDTITTKLNLDGSFSNLNAFNSVFGFVNTDSSGSKFIQLTSIDSIPLNIVVYWHRKWFLGKKSYKVEATTPNKSALIKELNVVITKD